MSNTFVNPSIVAKEALRQLKNNLVMGRNVYRGYEEEWKKESNGYKVDDTITIKAPVYFRVKNGATLDEVDLYERSTTFQIAYRKHVAWVVTAQQMTLNIDKFSKRFIQPAMQALANYIDLTLCGLYTDVPNQVGTPDTTPSSTYVFGQAAARLDEEACPADNRICIIDPQAQAKMADHLKGMFHTQMVGEAIKKNRLPSLAGFDMYMSQNVRTHTNGTWAGVSDITKDGATSEGDATLALKSGGTSETVKHGDIFTIATVNSVNPISGEDTGSLRQFVADADTNMDGSGEIAALTCTPGTAPYKIYSGSADEEYKPYQNVSAVPANSDAVTVAGGSAAQYKANLAFHKDAFGLAMVPLEMPVSASWKAQESYEGYTIRVIRDYDVTYDKEYIRFDVLFAVKTLNPMLACRIAGQ